ncbi:hypothetical protein JK359_31905 [Streptomyces actinomycinicus]|uniref:Uncharacterized protein n=1 Tax=Streptomyces actinomycinicus TaxID=1695166 RepID=A0A937EP53_9ACTN|nr:hypothetical protein [Streptomyces actinomycinicus]MBL1086511.1 hypothetical protein [Streptomyces actinomycinicus]
MSKGLLSVATGNTPGVRGALVDQLLGLAPDATVLAVSIHTQDTGYPIVQRCRSDTATPLPRRALQGATGDPVVILRQDLLSLRRTSGPAHVVLALPDSVDVLALLVELWRPRMSSGSLGEYYDPAPVVVGIDTESFMADIGCVHGTERLWSGGDQGESVTAAEAAARQAEVADAPIVPRPASPAYGTGGVELFRQLNGHALMPTPVGAERAADDRAVREPGKLWARRSTT